ncbi:hypothetical protein DMENIID0001_124660 [Sergentomyia squamirostris]
MYILKLDFDPCTGDTLETGHYTAACRNPYDQQFYKFDDQNVTRVNSETIEDDIINNEAYILFYQRRKIDVTECSGGSSSSGDHWVSRITATTAPSGAVSEETTKVGEKSTEIKKKIPEAEKCVEVKATEVEEVKVVEEQQSTVVVTEAEVTESAVSQEDVEAIVEEAEEAKEAPKEAEKDASLKEEIILSKQNSQDSLAALEDDAEIGKIEEERFFNSVPDQRINWLRAFDDNYDVTRRQSLSSAGFLASAANCESHLRRSTGPCSKDTLMYIDQQSHPALEDEDAILATSHSIWITPVASHKLISVSPKN